MKIISYIYLSLCVLSQVSCKKIIEIDPPKSSLIQKTIFQSDEVATSALTGIYQSLSLTNNSFASGGSSSVSCLAGASSDELHGYNPDIIEFYENQIIPTNSSVGTLYRSPYVSIYTANAILEGLESPNGVTLPVKTQLKGEALFIRAFCYFYLVNLFGPVPLQLVTDYKITKNAPRSPVSDVYKQIISDLKSSEQLLSSSYVTKERVRPNKSTVQALLARTYLYIHDWENAEKYSSLVIENTSLYSLVELDAIFLKNSNEAIWQLMPTANTNTAEGASFVLTSGNSVPIFASLRKDFVDKAFDAGDKRKTSWVGSVSGTAGTYYYPFKYKIKSSSTVVEYSMIFRLAEQYLIRAEARINQNKIELGITDLNTLRQRPISGINTNPISALPTDMNISDALLSVERERRVELFSEWGHRWLDLKRLGKINAVMSLIKTNWEATDAFYPITTTEINLNPNVKQNTGY